MKEKDLTNKIVEAGELIRGRREVIKLGFAAGITGAAALISDVFSLPTLGQARASKAGDIKIMNTALALEHQAIAAYAVGADSKLLKDTTLELAVHFQSQHKAHRDALEATIKKFGGTPVPAKEKYDFDTSKIKEANDVLRFALALEAGAASAYLGVLQSLFTKDLLPVVAGIAADEAQHAAVLRFAIGEQPAPDAVVK